MKVLKPGDGRRGWARECKCTGAGNDGGGCGALLLVEEADLRVTTRCCRDEVDYFLTFRCPECGVDTDVKNPPPGLLQRLRAGKKPETDK